jgi:hypothetical protein
MEEGRQGVKVILNLRNTTQYIYQNLSFWPA